MAGRLIITDTMWRRRGSGGPYLLAAAGGLVLVVFVMRQPVQGISPPPQRSIVAEFDTVDLPTPAEPIPAGYPVRNIKVRTIAYPKHQIPAGSLRVLSEYDGAVTAVALPAGLPIFAENLSFARGSSNPVMDKIPPGMRAMTVRVDATSAVEGWAGSGSVVDVLLVEKERTSVIAEKVTVLSAERSVSPVDGLNAPNVPNTVTLLVTQDQCLAINTAQPLGKIAFALRGRSDEQNWGQKSFTSNGFVERRGSLGERSKITGMASYKDPSGVKKFALTGDTWLPAELGK